MFEKREETRTEAPTPRRREQARQQGEVALSQELTTGLLLLASTAALAFLAERLAGGLVMGLQFDLLRLHGTEFDIGQAQALFLAQLGRWAKLLWPFFALVLLTGLGSGLLQVGFLLTPEMLTPRWERLLPAKGWARLFSWAAVIRTLLAVVKVAAAAAAATTTTALQEHGHSPLPRLAGGAITLLVIDNDFGRMHQLRRPPLVRQPDRAALVQRPAHLLQRDLRIFPPRRSVWSATKASVSKHNSRCRGHAT